MNRPKVLLTFLRRLFFPPPAMAGVVVCGVLVRHRAAPARVSERDARTSVLADLTRWGQAEPYLDV